MNMVRNGLLRALIPFVILSGMALALQLSNKFSDAKGTFVVGIILAAVAGFSVIYDNESWSLLKQSVVHTGCMAVVVPPCLVLSGWFTIDGPLDVLVIVGYFVVTGVVVWSIGYLVFGKLLNRSGRKLREDAP